MANEFIIRKGFKSLQDSELTGSLNLSGNIVAGGTVEASFASNTSTAISGAFDSVSSSLSSRIADQESFSSSLDATYATDAQVSTAVSALNNATSSYALENSISGSFTSLSSSLASELLKNTTDTLTGDLTVTGTLTAQDLHVQEVTSSIVFSSGSNKFGALSTDTQKFTGSLEVNGSSHYLLGDVGIGTAGPETALHLYTSGTSNKQLMIDQGSTGDAVMSFRLAGVSEYVMGIDNSDSDKFKIANSGNVGTSTLLTIDSSGNATFAGTITADTVDGTAITDGFITMGFAQINRYGAAVELQYTPTNAATLVKIGANGSNPTIFNAYTGDATFAGNINTAQDKRISVGAWDNSGFGSGQMYGFSVTSSTPLLHLTESDQTNKKGYIGLSGGNMYVGGLISNLYLQTGTSGTTALSIDSSQNATFAGNVTFGDSHFIGDDADDNLLIQSSANENIIINSVDDLFLRTGGTTKLTVKNGGNVGIGDPSPQGKLEVNNRNTATGAALFIKGGEDDLSPIAGQYTGLAFGYGGGDIYNNAAILWEFTNTAANGKLHFAVNPTAGDGTANLSDSKMTILDSGYVGIGTVTPDTLLHIYNPDTNWGAYSVITLGTDVEGTNQAQLKYYRGASTATESFQLSVRGTTALTALYNGNIGIGTTSPNADLEVKTLSGGSGVNTLRLHTSFANGNTVDINPFITGLNNGGMEIKLAGSQKLVMLPSGNVGIGETAPAAKLQVSGDRDGNSEYVAILGEDGGANGAANSGNTTPVHKTLLTGYSIPYSGQTNARLTSVGFLEFDSTPGWTGNQRNYALTSGYEMGGTNGPKFAILMGNTQNVEPQLGTNGSVGSGTGDGANTRVCSYWDNGGNMTIPEGGLNVNGVLGIGTTAPSRELDIQASSGWAEIALRGNTGGGGSLEFWTNTTKRAEIFADTEDIVFRNTASNKERLRIDSNGIMYIMGATASTNNSLQMQYNSTAGTAEIYSKSTGGNTSFEFYASNAGTTNKVVTFDKEGIITSKTNNGAYTATHLRTITIPYTGSSGTFTFDIDPVATFGTRVSGGRMKLEVSGWGTRMNAGYIVYRNDGSGSGKVGAGAVIYYRYAWSETSGTEAMVAVSLPSSTTNVVRISFSGWHGNDHGFEARLTATS